MWHRTTSRQHLTAGALIVLQCLGTTQVSDAQTSGAQLPTEDAHLESVVVTARRRTENLQQVPVSVTAVTAGEIEARSAPSLGSIAQSAPNVSFDTQLQTASSALVFIRGIGQTDAIPTNDPGVGIYLDGVYLGRMQGIDLNMTDTERVEILRGPQGTLFGKNTIGGAINIVSRKPDLDADASSGRIRLIGGNLDRVDGTLNANIRVVPQKLALSFAATSRNEHGFGRSLATGQDQGNVNRRAGRLVARLRPTEAFEAEASLDGTRDHANAAFIRLVAINPNAPLVGLYNLLSPVKFDSGSLTNDWYANYAGPPNLADDQMWGAGLTLTWHAGDFDVKSISAYRNNGAHSGITVDASNPAKAWADIRDHQNQVSQELQFSGQSFEQRLNWVGGLYYLRERATEDLDINIWPELYTLVGLNLRFIKFLGIDNTSYAAYGQGTYKLTDHWHFTLGARYSYDAKTDSVQYNLGYTGDTLIPFTEKSLHSSATTPRFGVEYQWTPLVMTYLSVASGYKVGGFNAGRAGAPGEFNAYNPEKVWTYEAGLRSDWLDERLRFNASLYYSRYQDIQVVVNGATPDGKEGTLIFNAATARIQGGELELIAVPVRRFKLGATVGFTDARYTSLSAGVPFSESARFPETPRWSSAAWVEDLIPLGPLGVLTGRVDYSYRSTVYHNPLNTPLATQGPYGLINARFTWQSPTEKWLLAAFGTNLADKHYFTGAFDNFGSLGFANVNPGRPREYGAEVTYRF